VDLGIKGIRHRPVSTVPAQHKAQCYEVVSGTPVLDAIRGGRGASGRSCASCSQEPEVVQGHVGESEVGELPDRRCLRNSGNVMVIVWWNSLGSGRSAPASVQSTAPAAHWRRVSIARSHVDPTTVMRPV
jgi:hypothetical protein